MVQLALQTFFLSHTAIRFPRRAESSYTSETEVSLNQALVNAQNASPSRSSRCGVFLLGEDSLGPGARATSYSTPRTSKLKNRKVNLEVNRVPSASSRHAVHALLRIWIRFAGACDSYIVLPVMTPARRDFATYIGHPGLPSPEHDKPRRGAHLVRAPFCLLLCGEGEIY